MTTDTLKISIDGDPSMPQYDAVRIARRWNGWAVPVVSKRTLIAMLRGLDLDEAGNAPEYRTAWVELADGSVMVEGPDDDEPAILAPDTDGLYTMDLGWVWDVVEEQ